MKWLIRSANRIGAFPAQKLAGDTRSSPEFANHLTAHTGLPSLGAVARGEAWCREALHHLAGRHQLSRAAMYRPEAAPRAVDPLDWSRTGPAACRTESRQVDLQTDWNGVGAANVVQSPATRDPGRKPCIRKKHGGARRLLGFSAWPRGFFAEAARKPSPGDLICILSRAGVWSA